MGERGPEPKYTDEQRRMQGNPGNRPLPPAGDDDQPQVMFPDLLTEAPPAPEWIGGKTRAGKLAKNAWYAVTQMLIDARTLRESDLHAVARFCRYSAEWVHLTERIDEDGYTVVNTTKSGETTAANPDVGTRAKIEQALVALEKELGLSPQARLNLQKRLMAHLRTQPLLGGNEKPKTGGAIGFLEGGDDDEED